MAGSQVNVTRALPGSARRQNMVLAGLEMAAAETLGVGHGPVGVGATLEAAALAVLPPAAMAGLSARATASNVPAKPRSHGPGRPRDLGSAIFRMLCTPFMQTWRHGAVWVIHDEKP